MMLVDFEWQLDCETVGHPLHCLFLDCILPYSLNLRVSQSSVRICHEGLFIDGGVLSDYGQSIGQLWHLIDRDVNGAQLELMQKPPS